MELSIIIPSFNTKDVLKKCLESIYKNSDKFSLEVIVVDNGSSDQTPNLIKKEFPKVNLIENNQNLGFSKAVNIGIKKSTGDYILLLNSDIIVLENSLLKLLEFAKSKKELGALGGCLLDLDGRVQASVINLPTISGALKEYLFKIKGSYEKYVPVGDEVSKVESVVGAVMLIPKSTIDKIGLLDEKYFMYFEDLDYCRRLRKNHLPIFYLPEAKFTHYHGFSGKNISGQTKNWLVESSKIYNGLIKYYLITLIIKISRKISFK